MSKLNILLITSDQQHWNTLGQFNSEIQTPALDRLATQGTTFTRAYCPNPTCTPTRSSLITGKYPSQHGAYSLGTMLPESEPTVGERFQSAGYRTALVGKAHFQPLHSTEEFPSLEAYPMLQDLDFWADFEGTILRLRSYRACPQSHGRSPCGPALRPLDGRKGLEQLARLSFCSRPAKLSHSAANG